MIIFVIVASVKWWQLSQQNRNNLQDDYIHAQVAHRDKRDRKESRREIDSRSQDARYAQQRQENFLGQTIELHTKRGMLSTPREFYKATSNYLLKN